MPAERRRELQLTAPHVRKDARPADGGQRGASMLEMLFAIAIMALAMPFAYRQVADIGADMGLMGAAKRLIEDARPVKSYMRMNADEFSDGEFVEVESEDEDPDRKIYISKDGGDITAFIAVSTWRNDVLAAHKIASMIGADAAVAESDGSAYGSAGDWAVRLGDSVPGDLIYRIFLEKRDEDTEKYLHRTVLSQDGLSTMKRDLLMGGFSIVEANGVSAGKLTATDMSAYLVSTPVIAANALYFANGLHLNPEMSSFPNIRVTGDVIGFRNFYTGDFQSPGGTLTADRANIADRLTVSNRFEVKAPYSRTVSGFAGASAGNVRCAYLDADVLTFMPGFGLVVSSELLYSSTPPVKLGAWTFPNSAGAGPRLNSLELKNLGGIDVAGKQPDFSEILKEGWK
jgi:hypothetical protein